MKKKFLTILMVGIMAFTLVSCSKDKEKVEGEKDKAAVTENEDKDSEKEEEGLKEKKVSKEEMINIANGYFDEFEKLLKEDGRPVIKADKSKDGIIVTDYIGYEINGRGEEPYKVYTCSLDASETSNGIAGFSIGIEYTINPDDVAKGKEIKVQDIGLEKYSNILLKNKKWDYDKINKEINEKLKNMTTEYVGVESGWEDGTNDGITGGFTVYKDAILYELGTGMYKFK